MEKIIWIPPRCFFWKKSIKPAVGWERKKGRGRRRLVAACAWSLQVCCPQWGRGGRVCTVQLTAQPTNKSCNPWYRKTNMGVDLIRTWQNSFIWAFFCSVTEDTIPRSCYDEDWSVWQSVTDTRKPKVWTNADVWDRVSWKRFSRQIEKCWEQKGQNNNYSVFAF